MEPIFDSSGRTVAWLDNVILRDIQGQPAAFLKGDAVWDYRGQYLGRLQNGYFRDRRGDAVAFLRDHGAGPLPPLAQLPPLPPLASIAPISPLTGLPPLAPLPSFAWSGLTWDDFLNVRRVLR